MSGAAMGISTSETLFDAIYDDDIGQARELLAAGADVNQQADEDGNTPLHLAIEKRQIAMVKLLLDGGADTNITNKYDYTVLRVAVNCAMTDIINLNSVLRQPEQNEEAMSIWTERTKLTKEILRLLLDHGADVHHVNIFSGLSVLQVVRDTRLVDEYLAAFIIKQLEARTRWTEIRRAWVGAVVRAPQVFYAGGGSAGPSNKRPCHHPSSE